ncbi:hypothetical protein K456DRAFT_1753397 [Colletotrichum gloeosporioides 23]|nr:hypothetical protein K456DRAFT_1753397 [Colletotrichum gloeosporioides 23]
MDRAKKCLAVLGRIIGIKKEKPEYDTEKLGAKKGWVYRPNYEFPWRLAQVVEEEENWRGTWVLDVKDLQAMEWGTTRVPKADEPALTKPGHE